MISSSGRGVGFAQGQHGIKTSLYFKKGTAGRPKPRREAALVSLAEGSSRARRELLGLQPRRGEEKETHHHKALIMKNGEGARAKNNKQ